MIDMNGTSVKLPPRAGRNGKTKYIYIVLTRTNGGIPQMIRTVTGDCYNHASVAFSATPHLLYSFARIHNISPLVGGPVAEYLCRFTHGGQARVPAAVFAISVTPETYRRARRIVRRIFNDDEYIYNLLSVASYPMLGGFETYKAYSCSEFVAVLLHLIGIDVGGRAPGCRPDDLFYFLQKYPDAQEIWHGDIRGYLKEPRNSPCRRDDFFALPNSDMAMEAGECFFELLRRTLGARAKHT